MEDRRSILHDIWIAYILGFETISDPGEDRQIHIFFPVSELFRATPVLSDLTLSLRTQQPYQQHVSLDL